MTNEVYTDTDSVSAMKTKLNSLYGTMAMLPKEYIVVHRDKNPIVIFKKSISAVECDIDGCALIYITYATFHTDEKYVDVIKHLV